METLLVRLKPHDPRRGHVLRRFTFRGIKFHDDRGWYRVDKSIAYYLREVHQVPGDEHTSLAFDVCTDDEAKALDEKEKKEAAPRKAAGDDITVSAARTEGAMTSRDIPEPQPEDTAKPASRKPKRS